MQRMHHSRLGTQSVTSNRSPLETIRFSCTRIPEIDRSINCTARSGLVPTPQTPNFHTGTVPGRTAFIQSPIRPRQIVGREHVRQYRCYRAIRRPLHGFPGPWGGAPADGPMISGFVLVTTGKPIESHGLAGLRFVSVIMVQLCLEVGDKL